MPTECAESGCTELTDSGICKVCSAEQKYGTTSRAYDADGSRVELREGETRDDDSHAGVVAAQLAEADDEDLEGLEDEEEVRTDGGTTSDDTGRSPPEEILDATTGGRGIWCDGQKENERTLFIDKRERDPGFCGQPNRYYQVQPDEVEDFRDLPYSDGSFDLVVFDPPHTIRENGMADLKGHVTKKYGALHAETWQDDLRRGFLELFRVLRPGGTLVFKFADEAADFERVLELAPEPPLFGTRTKQSKQIETRWFVFLKQRSQESDTDGSEATQ